MASQTLSFFRIGAGTRSCVTSTELLLFAGAPLSVYTSRSFRCSRYHVLNKLNSESEPDNRRQKPLLQTHIARVASAPVLTTGVPSPAGPFESDLDFKPRLSKSTQILCWTLPYVAICVWPLYALSRGASAVDVPITFARAAFQALVLTLKTLLSFALSYVLQCALLQRQYAQKERPCERLGDADSQFLLVDGLRVHFKCAESAVPSQDEATPVAVALHHGFGANLWSWREVQPGLATALGALVTAHDMPGFGLTERSEDILKYSPPVNGAIGRCVLDHVLTARGLIAGDDASSAGAGPVEAAKADIVRGRVPEADAAGEEDENGPGGTGAGDGVARVLVGHSLGCAGVLEQVVANPRGVGGVVLVAPAIAMSPFLRARLHSSAGASETSEGAHVVRERWELADPAPGAEEVLTAEAESLKRTSRLRLVLASVGVALLRLLFSAVITAARPILTVALRSIVRNKGFWETGLSNAYFEKSKLSAALVYYYRLPALARGWDAGIVRFAEAAARSALSPLWAVRRASLLKRFKDAVDAHGIPVIILHGQQDVIVPISNSTRLSASLGGAELVRIVNCGHTPAEETPECFIAEVARFVEREVRGRSSGSQL